MRKAIKTISVDADNWDEVSRKYTNMSGLINEYLGNLAKIHTKNAEFDLKILENELKIKLDDFNKLKAELKELEEQKEILVKNEQNKEKEMLEKEKEIEAKKIYCLKCGQILPNEFNRIRYKDGWVHLDCFKNLPKEEKNEVLK